MLLWIGFATLTAGVLAALLRPLALNQSGGNQPTEANLSVYRDQLREIEADRERGLIEGDEAEAARAEVARRLLASAQGTPESQPIEASSGIGATADHIKSIRLAIAGAVPLISVVLYVMAGSPGMPARPHQPLGAKPVEQASREELIAMVEARLREVPGDGQGWDVIAPVYFGMGRFADAQEAYANAIQYLGESPKRLKGVAESTIIANNGMVTEDARKAFQRLLELEPGNGEARFGLALALEQDGKLSEAAEAYRTILAEAPSDAPWRPALEVRVARLMRGGGVPDASAPSPEASKDEQEKFILGMVERLAARLKENGKDLAGWQQLVRSYKVLGRESDAVGALAEARRNFEGDPKALSALAELAASLGLKS